MASTSSDLGPRRFGHPNDLDRKRIERALAKRARYRYVLPRVLPEARGYRIESPCCSRNIDAEGGVILVGDHFAWSSREPAVAGTKLNIVAKNLGPIAM